MNSASAAHNRDSTQKAHALRYDYTRPGVYPRSGRVALGGVAYLARAIDKMRADLQGTAGEYIAACPQSKLVYDFFGVSPAQFREAVRTTPTDEGVLRWLEEHGYRPSPDEVARFNDDMLSATAPDEFREHLYQDLVKAGHPDRADVRTFVDFQDVEEGRHVPWREQPGEQRPAAAA